jgi:hypothetical protein
MPTLPEPPTDPADLFAYLLARADTRTFRVPDVGMVAVTIGEEMTPTAYPTLGTTPVYRVAVNGVTVRTGTNWLLPAGEVSDSVDSALALLWFTDVSDYTDRLWWWVVSRDAIRNAIAVAAQDGHDVLDAARECRARAADQAAD